MRCYIFGGSGFIGSHIIEELLRNNHNVINYDLEPSGKGYKVYGGRYIYSQGDIRDSQSEFKMLFDRKPPDIVFIFSAMANIEECEKDPVKAMNVNVVGLVNLLQAISDIRDREEYKIEKNNFGKAKLPKVVFASSMYAVSANHPYGISKLAGERLLKWYAKKYNFPYLIFRYGTVYGPRAGEDNGIKRLIGKALCGGDVEYYGKGDEIREYIHVKDVAKATVGLMKYPSNETFVITGPNAMTSKQLCSMLGEMMGKEIVYFNHTKPDGHYTYTPYRYEEDRSIKHIPDNIVDFGDGLLEVIEEVRNERI